MLSICRDVRYQQSSTPACSNDLRAELPLARQEAGLLAGDPPPLQAFRIARYPKNVAVLFNETGDCSIYNRFQLLGIKTAIQRWP